MRSYVPAYEVVRARTLADVTRRLAAEPGVWAPLAGGTDVMVLFEAGQLNQNKFINIWGLGELHGIRADAAYVELGALTTFADVQRHPLLKQEFSGLCRAGFETGGIAIQNRGTLGGNIANASPAADSPPALLAYDAEVKLVSARGERWLPYDGFHSGYKRTAMRPDELIAAVRLPRTAVPRHHYYRKVGTRLAQAISKVVMAARADFAADGSLASVRIALGSVGPVTLRCKRTEAVLTGQKPAPALADAAAKMLVDEIAPIDDIRSTAEYRRTVAANLVRQFALAATAPGG